MPRFPFRGLSFLNLTGRLVNVHFKRHGGRLTITVWGRMPLHHERRQGRGGRFIEVRPSEPLSVSHSDFNQPLAIEDAQDPPCTILYEGFKRGQPDLDCVPGYDLATGIVSLTLILKKRPTPASN